LFFKYLKFLKHYGQQAGFEGDFLVIKFHFNFPLLVWGKEGDKITIEFLTRFIKGKAKNCKTCYESYVY